MGDLDRIRWRCRRGLLELDLVLKSFLEKRLDQLDEDQLKVFNELLDEPDNDLLDLVMGRVEPASRYRAVVDMLRAA